MSLPTPIYDLKQFDSVYEPSEDTFLFIDALEADLEYIHSLRPSCILEVGSGSGIVITSLARHFQTQCLFFATDINPVACLCTKQTAYLNNVVVHCTNMNLYCNFKSIFDIILFNPPYVCTEDSEIKPGINRSWAGGSDGRIIIDQFLSQLELFLSDSGVCYMVALKENKPYEIMATMKVLGFNSCIIKERRILGEHLFVIRFIKEGNVK